MTTTIQQQQQEEEQIFRCIVCDCNADGFIELALGWRDEPLSQLYMCKRDYDMIYYDNNEQEWHKLK